MSFTTTAKVKTLLGIPAADTSQDARIDLLVAAANAEMLGYFNLTSCDPTAYTNSYDFIDDAETQDVWLRQYPVISVDEVKFAGTVQDTSDYYLSNPAEFGLLSLTATTNTVPFFWRGRAAPGFPYGRQLTEVTHTAGWAGGTPPADLQAAGALIAVARYNMDPKTGLAGEKIGQYSYTAGGGGGAGGSGGIAADGMPVSARRALSRHLRVHAFDH